MAWKGLIAMAVLALQPVYALWPIPQEVSTGSDVLFINKNIKVTYNGALVNWKSGNTQSKRNFRAKNLAIRSNNTTPMTSSQIVQNGVSRAMKTIFDQGFVPWMLNEPGSDYEPSIYGGKATVTSLSITQTSNSNNSTPIIGSIDETYFLSLSVSGDATIKANSSTGVLHGLETFTQLFYKHSSGSNWYTNHAPVSIQDAPKFPYRGLLLDTGRHFYPVEDIKRTIDGIAMNKMNILHWHVTETQSWPLEIPALPKLAEAGRYAPGLTYSPDDVASVLKYGMARGVQVILEIDMPGHQMAGKAYPDVGVAYQAKPWSTYCAEPPCGALRLNSTATKQFVNMLFDDLLPRLKPYAAYFHTGGDEYKAANSLLDPTLKTDDVAVLQPLLQAFLDHAHGAVRKHDFVPIVWEEMVGQWNATVGNDTIVQTWFGDTLKQYAEAGHRVIDSNAKVYYLDCGRGAWIDGAVAPYSDWCPPAKPWQLIYTHNPVDGLSSDAAKNVIGGEVAIWSENIDSAALDTLAWPRSSAAAESWWSGVTDSRGNARNLSSARPRLSEMRARMMARGVKGAAVTTGYCEQMPYGACV